MRITNDAEKLWELIKGFEVAMFTTEEADGSLRSRPMATLDSDFEGDLWFFTDASSSKVDEIHFHRKVNLTYVDAQKNRYVSVSGTAHLVRDKDKQRELWSPSLDSWLADGPDSPEVVLLRVHVEKAEYWDSPSSRMVRLVGFLTGAKSSDQREPAEHRKLSLTH